MPSGIDFYSQSEDRYDVEAKKRGSIMDVLSLLSLGSISVGGAAAKEGAKAAAKTSLQSAGTSQLAAEAGKFGAKVSLGGTTSTIGSSGSHLVAESAGRESVKQAAMAQMAKYLGTGKKEGLSTLVNNVLPPSGSGVVNPEVTPLAKPPQESFSEWTANQNQPQSKGSFLGGLKKGALGMPQEAGETSPWFYAGALIPSVIRSKLGVDTTFEAAYRNKMGDYYDAASNGYGIKDNLDPISRKNLLDALNSRLPGYIPGKNRVLFNDETGELKYE